MIWILAIEDPARKLGAEAQHWHIEFDLDLFAVVGGAGQGGKGDDEPVFLQVRFKLIQVYLLAIDSDRAHGVGVDVGQDLQPVKAGVVRFKSREHDICEGRRLEAIDLGWPDFTDEGLGREGFAQL